MSKIPTEIYRRVVYFGPLTKLNSFASSTGTIRIDESDDDNENKVDGDMKQSFFQSQTISA